MVCLTAADRVPNTADLLKRRAAQYLQSLSVLAFFCVPTATSSCQKGSKLAAYIAHGFCTTFVGAWGRVTSIFPTAAFKIGHELRLFIILSIKDVLYVPIFVHREILFFRSFHDVSLVLHFDGSGRICSGGYTSSDLRLECRHRLLALLACNFRPRWRRFGRVS